jgi:hypothetical protein
MSFFYLAWAVLLYYRALILFHQKEADRSYQQWVQCVFDNYDTTAPSSSDGGGDQNAWWRAVCGRHAHYRIPFIPSVLAFAMTTGTGLMLFCACSVSLSGLLKEKVNTLLAQLRTNVVRAGRVRPLGPQ